jgi:hypothetical protein
VTDGKLNIEKGVMDLDNDASEVSMVSLSYEDKVSRSEDRFLRLFLLFCTKTKATRPWF